MAQFNVLATVLLLTVFLRVNTADKDVEPIPGLYHNYARVEESITLKCPYIGVNTDEEIKDDAEDASVQNWYKGTSKDPLDVGGEKYRAFFSDIDTGDVGTVYSLEITDLKLSDGDAYTCEFFGGKHTLSLVVYTEPECTIDGKTETTIQAGTMIRPKCMVSFSGYYLPQLRLTNRKDVNISEDFTTTTKVKPTKSVTLEKEIKAMTNYSTDKDPIQCQVSFSSEDIYKVRDVPAELKDAWVSQMVLATLAAQCEFDLTITGEVVEDAPPAAPVDGGWGVWSPYSECDRNCGPGHKTRNRKCDNPVPQHKGKECDPNGATDVRDCNIKNCTGREIHGKWGVWKAADTCTQSCGIGGKVTMKRKCDNPKPANGGADCDKNKEGDTKIESCNEEIICPVHGNWSKWKAGRCTRTCGPGTLESKRECNNPRPSMGGRQCEGMTIKVDDCTVKECQAGHWSAWDYPSCPVTCGGAEITVTRMCINNEGGKDCGTDNTKVEDCGTANCPSDDEEPQPVTNTQPPIETGREAQQVKPKDAMAVRFYPGAGLLVVMAFLAAFI